MYRPRSRPAPPKMALSIAQLFVVVILAVFCEVDAFSIPIAFSRQKATTLRQSVLSNISPMYYKQLSSQSRTNRVGFQSTMGLLSATESCIGIAQAVSDDVVKYFISGGIAASFSHGITVPIDVVKTRLQTDDSLRSSGIVRATTTIVRNEGISVLSIGLGSTLVGYAIQVTF